MNSLEAWIRLYEDEMTYARQHESLRTSSTHLIAGATGAVLALLVSETIPLNKQSVLPSALAAFVTIINVVGFLLGKKHYERARRHQAIAQAYRKVISKNCQAGAKILSHVRTGAIDQQECGRFRFWATRVHVHTLWGIIHLVIGVLGLVTVSLLCLLLVYYVWPLSRLL